MQLHNTSHTLQKHVGWERLLKRMTRAGDTQLHVPFEARIVETVVNMEIEGQSVKIGEGSLVLPRAGTNGMGRGQSRWMQHMSKDTSRDGTRFLHAHERRQNEMNRTQDACTEGRGYIVIHGRCENPILKKQRRGGGGGQ